MLKLFRVGPVKKNHPVYLLFRLRRVAVPQIPVLVQT